MAKRKKKEPVAEQTTVEVQTAAPAREAPPLETKAEPEPMAEEPARPTARRYPDSNQPFSLAHNHVAGVRLLKFDRFKQVQLQFRDELPRELANQLQEGGWTYRHGEDVFTKQYGSRGEPLAILEAKRLYNRLVDELTPAGAGKSR